MIYINGRFLTQKKTGVQLYAIEICKELLENGIRIKILTPQTTLEIPSFLKPYIQKIGVLNGHPWEQIELAFFLLKRPSSKIIHLCNTGCVFIKNDFYTLHDIAFTKKENWFSKKFRIAYRIIIPILLKRAKHIITVSNTVKKEIENYYNIDSSKIVVLSNKIPSSLLSAVPLQISSLENTSYFLMVGSLDPRKNFKWVIDIFEKQFASEKLVIVGCKNKNFTALNLNTNQNIILLDYVNDEKLSWLYSHAKAFINPSKYEGFGIPNLEAMAFNCPIICSNIPVYKEVCKNSAYYFELDNEKSLIRIINSFLENKAMENIKIEHSKGIFANYQNSNRVDILKKVF